MTDLYRETVESRSTNFLLSLTDRIGMVVAQLVERSLPTPVIRKLSNRTFVCLLSTVFRGRKEKWPGIAHFKKKTLKDY